MKIFMYSLIILMSGNLSGQKDNSALFIYKKGACMGKCPVFSVVVDNSGLLTYHGIVNVEKEGIYKRQLSAKEFKKLKRKLKRTKFHKLNESYGMDVMDLPMTTFHYKTDKLNKKISAKMEVPKKLLKTEKYLTSLFEDSPEVAYSWKMEKGPSQSFGRKEMAERMIIAQLKPDVQLEDWLNKYKKYNVRMTKKIVPNRPLYLLVYNPATIQLPQLLKMMNEDSLVHSAEENKKIKMRN